MNLEGASAIVTGGAGGFGEATVRRLVAAGAKVVIADMADEKGKLLADDLGENARFAARICRAHGWKKVVVVSEPFHLYRAGRDFRGAGLTPYVSPTLSSRLAQARLRSLLFTAREAVLLVRDMLWRAG